MTESDKRKTIKNAVKIVSLVATSSSISREGNIFGEIILPAQIIYDKINCSEIEFVKALKIVKKKFKNAYNRLKIPKCWDGSSNHFFPEAYESDDRIFCEVICDDLSANIFYDLPSNQTRKWKHGDKVYVPYNHQITIDCLREKKLKIIN